MKTKSTVFSLSILLLVLMIGVPSAMAGRGFKIEDPGRKVSGKTYGQWANDWWTWALSFPADENPLLDETGDLCDLGDQGKVWFLAGNFGGTTVRDCTAPQGKKFFFPLFNVISFAPEFGDTVEEIRMDANDDVDYALDPDPTFTCEIDGVPVGDLFAYRAQSPPGGFELPASALLVEFGLDEGPRFPAIADGYWLMVKGLKRGVHEIHFTAVAPGIDLDVTYFLTIERKRKGRK